ncbi:hypothetical protein GC174_08655 [bacterium]|nr:hypothetical protein [bacterium]
MGAILHGVLPPIQSSARRLLARIAPMQNMSWGRKLFDFSQEYQFGDEETFTDLPALSFDFDPSLSKDKRHDRYVMLANSNLVRFKMEKAMRCVQKALCISVRNHGPDHLQVGDDLELLGKIMYLKGSAQASESIMARAKRIKKRYES